MSHPRLLFIIQFQSFKASPRFLHQMNEFFSISIRQQGFELNSSHSLVSSYNNQSSKYHTYFITNIARDFLKVTPHNFFIWAIPGHFLIYFRPFKHTLQQINVKNGHPVYGAGIRTHNLWKRVSFHNHQTRVYFRQFDKVDCT